MRKMKEEKEFLSGVTAGVFQREYLHNTIQWP